MTYRGYNISSTYLAMHFEFDFLRIFFNNNGFPTSLIYSQIKMFLHDQNLNFRNNTIETSDLNYFVSFPYYGHQSEKLKSELNTIFSKIFSFHKCLLDFHEQIDHWIILPLQR